ncbi:MAG: response regulator receiver [Gemmatimonadetes bacterium]|nr:response regulator receiver [Gemmatimonadota bacterium]
MLIADDEPIAREALATMLRAFDWLSCVGEVADGLSAIEAIDRLRPELVFLDVAMPGAQGTDVLRRVHHRPYVIFTTAYSEHAVIAFELGAVDYLVKPFGQERIAAALDRIRAAVGEPAPSDVADRLTSVFDSTMVSRLFVRTSGGLTPVLLRDVAFLESSGDYVVAHVARARHLIHLSLTRLEMRLDPSRFIRIHRTCIVNLDHLKSFRPETQGRLTAVMHDGTRLMVSRARAQAIRALGI